MKCREIVYIMVSYIQSSKPSTSYKRKIFLYDKGDFDSYRQQLTDVDWETLFGHNDVDTIVDIITNTILNIADNTIPNRFITVQKDSRPWITTSIKKFIRRKNRIHKKDKTYKFYKPLGKVSYNQEQMQ